MNDQPYKRCVTVSADLRRLTAAPAPPARYASGHFELPKNSVLGLWGAPHSIARSPTSGDVFRAIEALHHTVRGSEAIGYEKSGSWHSRGCSLPTLPCPLLPASRSVPCSFVPSLATVLCPPPTAHHPLSTAHCPPPTAHRPLPTAHRPPPTPCSLPPAPWTVELGRAVTTGSLGDCLPFLRTQNRWLSGLRTSSIRWVLPPRRFKLMRKSADSRGTGYPSYGKTRNVNLTPRLP